MRPSSPSFPPRSPSPWRGLLIGLVLGAALAVLAALLGDIRATSAVLLGIIGVCGLLGIYRPTRRLLQGGAGLLALTLAACLLTPVLRGPLNALVLSEAPVKADAIVVLGGGVNCGRGTLESSSLARLIRGLELWRAGYAPVITLSEQSGIIGPAHCPKVSDLEKTLIRNLYPVGGPNIATLKNVTTTRDEAARVRDLARQQGWRRVLLVTSPSHSRRAANLFRGYGVNAISVNAQETRLDFALQLPGDRFTAFNILLYEGLSRLLYLLGLTPER